MTDSPAPGQARWLWVDLETTGLGYDPDEPARSVDDQILEVAAVATTGDLEVVETFGPLPVRTSPAGLALMSDYVRQMHTSTGLLDRIAGDDALTIAAVDAALSDWMGRLGLDEKVILAGSSVKLDFDFMRRHMPSTFARLHYRVIDVSSFKEALRAWAPQFVEWLEAGWVTKHQAMDDILDSIGELRAYRTLFTAEEVA